MSPGYSRYDDRDAEPHDWDAEEASYEGGQSGEWIDLWDDERASEEYWSCQDSVMHHE